MAQAPYTNAALEELVRDRPLVTSEIVGPNAYYGHDVILKRHAGLPEDRSLKVLLPHGVEITSQPFFEQRERLPVIVHFNPMMGPLYRSLGFQHVWALPAPYVFVVAADDRAPAEREGTLHFPSHSLPGHIAGYDAAGAVETLKRLDDRFQPVTVCVHWLDVHLGRHQVYADAGFPIVTAGHAYDPEFLYRFHDLCSRFRYASGNDIGSHAFYAIKSGCQFLNLGLRATWPEHTGFAADDDPLYLGLYAALLGSEPAPYAEQLRLADLLLGTSSMVTPDELRSRLEHAERLDRWGFLAQAGPRRRRLAVPPYWRRLAANAARRALGRARRRHPEPLVTELLRHDEDATAVDEP